MKRIDAIKEIMKNIKDDDIIVSSTGMISREVYEVKDRLLNFYMQGSMGNALAIGLGIALNTTKRVFVINGDASALMSLGTFITHKKLNPSNLTHVILDNNSHASTGGQKTVSNKINFNILAPNTYTLKVEKEKGKSERIPLSCKEITKRFKNKIQEL